MPCRLQFFRGPRLQPLMLASITCVTDARHTQPGTDAGMEISKQHCIVQVEENYQRQMGITAAQHRTDAYMRTHTLTHQAILNPTSRVPVYPSEAVLVKPVGFGLGRSSPEAVRKVAAKHGAGAVDLQDCPLLPSQYRWGLACAGVAFTDEPCSMTRFQTLSALLPVALLLCKCRSHSSSPVRKQLQELDALDTAQPHDDDAPLSDDPSGTDDNTEDVDGPGSSSGPGAGNNDGSRGRSQRQPGQQLQAAKLSKYEAAKLEQAKQRHKAQIAQPKVGKTLHARSRTGETLAGGASEHIRSNRMCVCITERSWRSAWC